jgi:tRNA U34 5-methylaminomethyl-2-thiouridine-forming methyltransferase MnmC
MADKDQRERVVWQDGGVPVSTLFDDPYYSLSGGLAEARHVFLAGNGLPDRMTDGFQIAELGFGTGLNLIAAILAWRAKGQCGTLRFTSFEAYPMPAADMARAHATFPEIESISSEIVPIWAAGSREFSIGSVKVNVITGNAQKTLPEWPVRADAWFLDGFSPVKNPGLWGEDLLAEVARHTSRGGTFATYTAAGGIRRGLRAAGFQVERVAGFGTKRHMTRGTLAI